MLGYTEPQRINNGFFCIVLLITFCMIPAVSAAKHLHYEKYYQQKYCLGQIEYMLYDRTRIDCLTDTEAIEFDFAEKWPEGLSQALYYGLVSKKKPALYLIKESNKDQKYINRAKAVVKHYSLPVNIIIVE